MRSRADLLRQYSRPAEAGVFEPWAVKTGLSIYWKEVALNIPLQKWIQVLNYVWLLVVLPLAVAIARRLSRPQREPWDLRRF